MHTLRFVLILLVSLQVIACGQSQLHRRPLTIGDVNTNLKVVEATPLDAVKSQNITYATTGKGEYDEFFKKTAIAHGGFEVGKTMSEDANVNLKRFARSHWSKIAVGEDLKDLLKDATPDTISAEQAVAILQAKRKELTKDEVRYFEETARNLGTAGVTVDASIKTIPQLLSQANKLLGTATTDFALWESSGIANEIQDSVTKLKQIKDDAPALTKNIFALSNALTMLTKA